jgi:hypothetical protein
MVYKDGNKRRGTKWENDVRKFFKKKGLLVIRSAGSFGVDLTVFGSVPSVRFLSCKSTLKGAYIDQWMKELEKEVVNYPFCDYSLEVWHRLRRKQTTVLQRYYVGLFLKSARMFKYSYDERIFKFNQFRHCPMELREGD